MIPIPALGLLTWLKIGATGALVLFLVGSCMARDARLAREASQKTIATIEKANAKAATKGRRAADRSADPGVRGPVDPSTRD